MPIAAAAVLASLLLSQFGLKPSPVELPAGNEAWVIRVIRSGGFTSDVVFDVSLNSSGSVRCRVTKSECPTGLDNDVLKEISQLVSAKIPESRPTVTTCNHCVITEVTVEYRDARGKVRKSFAAWSDSSPARVPMEMRTLAAMVIASTR